MPPSLRLDPPRLGRTPFGRTGKAAHCTVTLLPKVLVHPNQGASVGCLQQVLGDLPYDRLGKALEDPTSLSAAWEIESCRENREVDHVLKHMNHIYIYTFKRWSKQNGDEPLDTEFLNLEHLTHRISQNNHRTVPHELYIPCSAAKGSVQLCPPSRSIDGRLPGLSAPRHDPPIRASRGILRFCERRIGVHGSTKVTPWNDHIDLSRRGLYRGVLYHQKYYIIKRVYIDYQGCIKGTKRS